MVRTSYCRSIRVISFLLVIFLLIPFAGNVSAADPSPRFYVYGSHACEDCVEALELLTSAFGEDSVVFYDLSDPRNTPYFDEIYDRAFSGMTQRIPLVGVFNGSLRAVVSGPHDIAFWRSMTEQDPLFIQYGDRESEHLSDAGDIERLEGLFLQTVEPSERNDAGIFLMVVLAALADSVNPCAFAVLVAFLTLISRKKGDVLRSGLAFSAAVFLVYLMMGFGLIMVFRSVPWLKLVVGIMGIVLGSVEIADAMKKKGSSSLIPESFRERTASAIRKAGDARAAFVMGLLVSLFLLPCTSGPYFIAMSLISEDSAPLGIALLLLYNLIFIAPLILITYLVHTSRSDSIGIKRWKERNSSKLSVGAGLLIIFLGIYIVLDYFRIL